MEIQELLVNVLTVAVLAWFGSRLFLAARHTFTTRAIADRSLLVVRGLRPRHFVPVPFVLAGVVATWTLLSFLPGLSFGWWSAIGGAGNPAVGSTEATAGTPLEYLLPLVFLTLLIPSLPLFVEAEERMFRLGAEEWSWPKRLKKAVTFGLVHAIIGIPIAVALALSVGGLWFTFAYLRGYRRGGRVEALLESTRMHLAYNTTIVTVVYVSFVLFAAASLS
ncbi:MAG TPA: hypothetical protein VMY34_02165 [Acidimicrobiales bacterium]|nr:hypothetical protein [Acidimicrobiales bacterium]